MRISNTLASCLFFGLLLTACKSENAKPATDSGASTAAPAATNAPTAKPEVYVYATVYDAMLLRAEPDTKAAVVEKLPVGTFLEGSGEKSTNKVEATLGGVTWSEPFLKVTQALPSPKNGWVFGGGVQAIYAGTRVGMPDMSRLGAFTAFLKTLNVKQLESGKKAWDFVRANFADAKGPLADAAYVLLQRFHRRMEAEGEYYAALESQNWSENDINAIWDGQYDMTKTAMARNFDAAGFCYATGEGQVFPIPDVRKYLSFFGANATPALRKYLEMEVKSQLQPEMTDAHLILEANELVDRAIAWEKFNAENPYFILADQTKESERWMRIMVINGDPSVQAYDYETGLLTDDSKKLAAYVLQKYPDSKMAKDVKAISELLVAEGGKKTPKVEQWVDAFLKRMEAE